MKLRNVVMNAVSRPKIKIQLDIVGKERSKSEPTSVSESLRSTSMRGGIQCCDLDDWLLGERELQEKFKDEEKELQKSEMRYRNDINIRERSATMGSLSLLGWFHILRAHLHWTVFQAIRYVLWLAR